MMEAIVDFFSGLENKPFIRLLLLAVPVALLWIIENSHPLFSLRYRRSKGNHALINFTFTFIHLLTHSLLATALVAVSIWCERNHFGLVPWLQAPLWGILLLGVLSMDFFGGWLVHWVEHRVPLFWRIHIVHHSDTKVDVTSGLRHHPLEAINRWLFFTLGVFLMGLPLYAVLLGQTFMSIFTMFTHANISLPPRIDQWISYVFVSPNMHKVHHHYKQPYTDSNFGTALSIWDRLLGTFRQLPTSQIQYGLDHYYDNNRDEEFTTLLRSPFENTAPGK